MERTTWSANGAIMSRILPEKGSGCWWNGRMDVGELGGIGDGLKATKKKGPSDREGIRLYSSRGSRGIAHQRTEEGE
ncbi:hypothetical protein EYF80_031896 [Liparis tanakae]|uniref:Uncharacterized protein n=1 Tax=Liparis tanakae TaxID=230148 RepID=A0A4Z2GW69_9TELE|nr:hypothetical protein EYF80_031896 [Liparis tanakae]